MEINVQVSPKKVIEVTITGAGLQGPRGVGVPEGGAINQIIQKTVDGTEWTSNPTHDTTGFNTDYIPTGNETISRIYWDTANHCLTAVYESGHKLQFGQENSFWAKNTSGVDIVNGDAVSLTAVGGDFTSVALTDCTDPTSAKSFVGLATMNVPKNQFGYFTYTGQVRDLNTNAHTEKAILYVDENNRGKLTMNMPTAPNYIVEVGHVEYKHATNGRIMVRPQIYIRMQDCSDFDGTPLETNGQFPVWNNDDEVFDPNYNVDQFAQLETPNHFNAGMTDNKDQIFSTNNEENMFVIKTDEDAVYIGGLINGIKISKGGLFELLGEASVFDDLQSQLVGARLESPSSKVVTNITNASVTFKLDATTSDYVTMAPQLSHKWKIGSKIYPHLHWEQISANVPNWLLQYRWQTQGGAKTTAWTNLIRKSINAFTYISGTLNQITAFGTDGITPPVGAGLSDIVDFRIIRDTTNASGLFAGVDPINANIEAKSFDAHPQYDSLGSNNEYSD